MKKQNILAMAFIALLVSTINFKLSAQCVNCDANSSASGSYASAMGMSANATGQASLAVGLEAYAYGNYSLALGKYVTSTGASSVTLGRYLEAATSPAMIIGTGYNSSNYLVNSISNSLMIGFNSNKSTLFVKGATGIGYTGKVGIGDITDPQAKLHIKADDGEAASLFLESWSFGGSYAADLWMGTQDYGLRAMYGKLYFNTGGNYIFNSANANVGIGVLTPHEKLEVSGNIKTTGFILENGQQATNKILQSDSHGQASWVDPMTLIVDDGDWVVNGNNMYSSVTGNVGIGVPSPGEKLDVNGTIKSVGFKLIDGNQAAGKILQSDASGNASWTNLPPAGDDDWTISGNNVYRLNGNVGIGIDPQEKLHVNGDIKAINMELTGELIAAQMNIADFDVGFLTVTGKIEAAEIEVKNLSKWKDEVFEDKYRLASLREVEQYVKEHKHLPDIPSEAEVLANGYNVGDMDALLLQKIEELTLYVIELEKRLNDTK